MKYILGTKEEMSQYYHEDGSVTPVTVIKAEPNTVLVKKTKESDGYCAIQIGIGNQKTHRLSKAMKGFLTKVLGDDNRGFTSIREFRLEDTERNVGDIIDVNVFEKGDGVTVTGTSKGKGFQGVVKRHNFAGGRRSHGQKHSEREPGSIGATGPQRVFKGTKMGGRMGSDTVTVKNLAVIDIDLETNRLFIKGAVPGRRGSLVRIIAS
jgi:large subunit ribosomal protein L3